MSTTEVLTFLQSQGIDATEARLRYAVLTGAIPRPTLNARGDMVWSGQLVAEAAEYLKRPRVRGRKPVRNGPRNGTAV